MEYDNKKASSLRLKRTEHTHARLESAWKIVQIDEKAEAAAAAEGRVLVKPFAKSGEFTNRDVKDGIVIGGLAGRAKKKRAAATKKKPSTKSVRDSVPIWPIHVHNR